MGSWCFTGLRVILSWPIAPRTRTFRSKQAWDSHVAAYEDEDNENIKEKEKE